MPNFTYNWIQTKIFHYRFRSKSFTCNELILGENLDLKSKVNQCQGLINVYFFDYDNCKKCLLSFLKRLPKFEEIAHFFMSSLGSASSFLQIVT